MIRLNHSTLLYSTRLPIQTFSHFNYWFKFSPLNEFLLTCQHQATAFDVQFYDIFAPTKNSFFEVSDDVIACDLRFGPLPIKNPGYAYAVYRFDFQTGHALLIPGKDTKCRTSGITRRGAKGSAASVVKSTRKLYSSKSFVTDKKTT